MQRSHPCTSRWACSTLPGTCTPCSARSAQCSLPQLAQTFTNSCSVWYPARTLCDRRMAFSLDSGESYLIVCIFNVVLHVRYAWTLLGSGRHMAYHFINTRLTFNVSYLPRIWQGPMCGMGMIHYRIVGLRCPPYPMNNALLATPHLPWWMESSLWWEDSCTMAMPATSCHILICNFTAGNRPPLWTSHVPNAWQVEDLLFSCTRMAGWHGFWYVEFINLICDKWSHCLQVLHVQ